MLLPHVGPRKPAAEPPGARGRGNGPNAQPACRVSDSLGPAATRAENDGTATMTTHPAFLNRLAPTESELLAEVCRSMGGVAWTTRVWVEPDGRYCATVVRGEGSELVASVRRIQAASLPELELTLSAELAERGPTGSARLAVLSSAALAFEQASDRAA